MTDNKLSWTELRRALMTRAGISEKEANSFLNAFNSQLVEALKQDKQVKVNGLGIFKLQAVAPRKSVDVTTGEEIMIEGYTKVTFAPEAGVKELIEKGEVKSERANATKSETIDPLKKLGAQAEEIVDILGELGQNPNKEDKNTEIPMKEAKPKKAKAPKKTASKPAAVVEEEVKEEVIAAEKPAEPVVEPEAPKVVISQPEAPKAPEAPQKPKKKYHFMRDTLICVVILLLLLLVGYFFLRSQFSEWIEAFVKDNPQTEQVVIVEEPESAEPEIVAEEVVPEEEWTYDELLLTEELTPGSRLAWISKKYYGDRVYWPYLYEANKDILSNPSKIAIGTPIRVPKLSPAQMDTTSARFLELKERAYNATR